MTEREERWVGQLALIHNALVVESFQQTEQFLSDLTYEQAASVTNTVLSALTRAFTDDSGVVHADQMLKFIRDWDQR